MSYNSCALQTWRLVSERFLQRDFSYPIYSAKSRYVARLPGVWLFHHGDGSEQHHDIGSYRRRPKAGEMTPKHVLKHGKLPDEHVLRHGKLPDEHVLKHEKLPDERILKHGVTHCQKKERNFKSSSYLVRNLSKGTYLRGIMEHFPMPKQTRNWQWQQEKRYLGRLVNADILLLLWA